MVKKYCDPTASNGYPAFAAVPTWGVPFDGDGIGKTKSTASALCIIDFTNATAVAGNAINIAGLTLTCVASGAAGANFNAGSGAALATNIATAINACTSAVPNAVAAGWATTTQINDVIYARANVTGGATLELMTRAGSDAYNANALFQVAISGVTGLTGPYQFSGGVSGCWSVLLNPSNAYLKSSRGYFSYGVFGNTPLVAGNTNPGDEVVCRAGTLIQNPPNTSSGFHYFRLLGTPNNPVIFTIDDGTEYPADAGQKLRIIVEIRFDNSTRSGGFLGCASTETFFRLQAKRYADYTSNFVFQVGASGGNVSIGATSGTVENMDFFSQFAVTTTGYVYAIGIATGTTLSSRAVHYRCRYFHWQNSQFVLACTSNYSKTMVDFVECEFSNGGTAYTQGNAVRAAAAPNTNVVNTAYGSYSVFNDMTFDSCKFTNFAPNSQLYGGAIYTGDPFSLRFRNTDFGNITIVRPLVAASAFSQTQNIYSYTSYGKGDYFRDTTAGFEEWNAARSYPVCNGILLDGSPWSVRLIASTQANNISINAPFESGRFVKKNTLPDGQRTISCEVAISDQVNWTSKEISLTVEYKATDGSLVTLSTLNVNAVALTPSATPWFAYAGGSAEVGGKVQYPFDNSLHNKFRLSVVTPAGKNIAADCLISAFVRIHTNVANNTVAVFVDPEITVV